MKVIILADYKKKIYEINTEMKLSPSVGDNIIYTEDNGTEWEAVVSEVTWCYQNPEIECFSKSKGKEWYLALNVEVTSAEKGAFEIDDEEQ